MPGAIQEFELEDKPGRWSFRRTDPFVELRGLVKEYWEVEGQLAPFRESILPHGWIEVMFNLGPPHRVMAGESAGVWTGAWVSGLHENAIAIESREGTHLISARLHPLGALELLGAKAPSCANRIVGLEQVIGEQAKIVEHRVASATSAAERFQVLEDFLRSNRAAANTPNFVKAAAHRIEESHGALRVSELHNDAGVSRRHLVARFTAAIGMSPRAYAKVHRFVWTLERLQGRETVDWAGLAWEAGYSDQSHLIRDFRRIGGTSAAAFLPRLAPGGIALWGANNESPP